MMPLAVGFLLALATYLAVALRLVFVLSRQLKRFPPEHQRDEIRRITALAFGWLTA